jgi:hypothetical protein
MRAADGGAFVYQAMPSEAVLREMYALNEGGHNVILKAGFIFKRNKTGNDPPHTAACARSCTLMTN